MNQNLDRHAVFNAASFGGLVPRLGIIALLIAGTAAAALGADRPQIVVSIDGGKIAGTVSEDMHIFRGIPYAAPPTGSLRWRAPEPINPWQGIRDASRFGADCMQEPFPGDAAPLGTEPSEDCLTVNVWQPARRRADMPVLVWLYGGGFVNGGASPAVYDGAAFARNGLIFVSFNYRVGRFGFFAHPALSAEGKEPLGNYGLMDQVAALRWIKRNIARFGGDPANVTIMGESAGGSSVLALMTAPQTRGLFHRAIVMSGNGRDPIGGLPLRSDDPAMVTAERTGINFAQSVGLDNRDRSVLARLRALPAAVVRGDLNIGTMMAQGGSTYAAGTIVDGKLIRDRTEALVKAGAMAKVPLLIGTTDRDLGFPSVKNKAELFQTFGKAAGQARSAYDPDGTQDFEQMAGEVARNRMMDEPMRFVAGHARAQGSPAWLYRFGYVARSMQAQWPGAPHASDIPYAFDTLPARYGNSVESVDRQVATRFHNYIVNFAKSGNPNGRNVPDWPIFDMKADNLMVFGRDGKNRAMIDPWKERLDAISHAREEP